MSDTKAGENQVNNAQIKKELIKSIKKALPRRIKFVKAKSEEAAHAPYSNFDYSVLEKNRTIMNPIVFDRDDQNHDSSNLFNDEEMIQNSMLPTGEERKKISKLSRLWLNSKQKNLNMDDLEKMEAQQTHSPFTLKRVSKPAEKPLPPPIEASPAPEKRPLPTPPPNATASEEPKDVEMKALSTSLLFDDWEVSNYEEESKKRQQEDLQQWTEERKQDEWDQLLDQGRTKKVKKAPTKPKSKVNKFEKVQHQKFLKRKRGE